MANGVVLELFDRPIAFQRSFVRVTGSITAALMLSQAVYWSLRVDDGRDGWFFKTQEEWEEETGLSRYEQETARRILKQKGFLLEKKKDTPCRIHYRVDGGVLQTSLWESRKLECGNPTDKAGENHQTITENTSETTPESTEQTLFAEQGSATPQPESKEALKPRERAERGIRKVLFPHYQEVCERAESYTLTVVRLKKGADRFLECLAKTKGDWNAAGEMFRSAIDALADSDFHMGRDPKTNGKRYCDWIDNLTKSAEQFEKWLVKAEEGR